MSELMVKELTPSLRDDFLYYFDHVAFADNPDWSDCYCSLYHFPNKGKAENRLEASSFVEQGKIHGFIAYDKGKPVGWCNATNRNNYPTLHWLMGPGPDKWERIGSIVCFNVASTHRNKTVASQLLDAACKKFTQEGLEYAEAYPVKKPLSDAYNFPGPLTMYLKAGFTEHRDADWYVVVRKKLQTEQSRALQLSLLLSTPFPGDYRSAAGSFPGTNCTSHALTREAQTVLAWDANTLPCPADQRSTDRWKRTKCMTDNSHVAKKCSSDSSAARTRYSP